VIHSEATVGVAKVLSAKHACARLNSSVVVEAHETLFQPSNAASLVERYACVCICMHAASA
jgi:molybdopterin/thiamine biosynthesis adenylyltransferase